MRRIFYIIFLLLNAKVSIAQTNYPQFCSIRFEQIANGKPLILNDSIYLNAFGEKYSVSKLKYYISDIQFVMDYTLDDLGQSEPKYYFLPEPNPVLIDASKENIIPFHKPFLGSIVGIEFLIGVDSILNCSGAQSDALDPLNDMFWTWNNGYVMFKLEGTSESSTADNHRIEQHIGGYIGPYKTMRKIYLPIEARPVNKTIKSLTIQLNLDDYWNGETKIKVAQTPVITMLGKNASEAADNFPKMFSISTIIID